MMEVILFNIYIIKKPILRTTKSFKSENVINTMRINYRLCNLICNRAAEKLRTMKVSSSRRKKERKRREEK